MVGNRQSSRSDEGETIHLYLRTFLKARMPSCPNLRPDMSHRLATPYLAPIGQEKVHLDLTNLIKGGGEG